MFGSNGCLIQRAAATFGRIRTGPIQTGSFTNGIKEDYRIELGSYRFKSENLSLTFPELFSKNLPSPRWEGIKPVLSGVEGGRGDQKVFIFSTPTLALPHRRGRV